MTRFEEEIVSPSAKRQNLRKHFRGGTCFQPASVFDPISARLADSLGFGIAIFPGSSASAVVLGAPDIALYLSMILSTKQDGSLVSLILVSSLMRITDMATQSM